MSAELSPLKQAYLALEKMQARVNHLERAATEPIAITGMACRFPGAANPGAFWNLLSTGGDAITEVPPNRWEIDRFYSPERGAPGKMYTRLGGFLEDIDRFDAAFFGISPREAASLDPQQRLLLEVSWEALEDAGTPADALAGSATGVFVGIGSNDYLRLLGDIKTQEPYYGTGNAFSIAAGRLSYFLGLEGPSMAVDTSCSSALVALHLACQSLRAGECQQALVAGVNAILTPETTIFFCRMGALSPDGHCKTFDATADGYVRSEGCATVILKRLSQALADGDPIHAVIRGSAVTQDGRSNGLTVPKGASQEQAIRGALAQAKVSPAEIGYVETHGTGTALGDPIEVNALGHVLAQARETPLAIGAVKANVGHLESAAGLAGLLKTVLILKHGHIPPQIHFQMPNPAINWRDGAITVPTTLTPWSGLAGVSSFGMNGTNAHAIIAPAPESEPMPPQPSRGMLLLPLSARSETALAELARRYQATLAAESWAEVCYTASVRRTHHPHRLALIAETAGSARAALDAWLAGHEPGNVWQGSSAAGRAPRVAFVFSGQGGQWSGMAQSLSHEPAFQAALAACETALAPHMDISLADALSMDDPPIDVLQPALFAYQVALTRLWQSWGVAPAAVVGHSMGEVAAAHLAGAITLEDAAHIITARSRLLRRVSGQGGMAVVDLSEAEAQQRLSGLEAQLSIAALNSLRSTVIAGDPAALDALLEQLQQENIFCRRVKVDVAAHSPQVASFKSELRDHLAHLQSATAHTSIFSTVTGTTGTTFDAEYWSRNLTEPVRFFDALQGLVDKGHTIFLEIGPHPVLTPAIRDGLSSLDNPALAALAALAIPSQHREEPATETLLAVLSALYVRGYTPQWTALYPAGRVVQNLPAYPWQKERFWVESAPPIAVASRPAAGGAVSDYYDAGADYHLTQSDSSNGHRGVLEGFLTYGFFPEIVPGFSWLQAVTFPDQHKAHAALLAESHKALRQEIFNGVDFSRLTRVMDFGCGYGSDLMALAQQHEHLILDGFTISGKQADIGHNRAKTHGIEHRVRIFHRDSAQTAFPGEYDLILGFEVAGLVEDKDALFKNVGDHLRVGGYLLMADFIANTVSSIDMPELSTYSSNATDWANLLARYGLRLMQVVDVSQEVANSLHDPNYDDNLAQIQAKLDLAPEFLRHLESYQNTYQALRRGLMRYGLFKAVRDDLSSEAALLQANLALLETPAERSTSTTPDALSDWLYQVTWQPQPLDPVSLGEAGTWLLVGDDDALGLRQALESRGATCLTLRAAPLETQIDALARSTTPLNGVIYWGDDLAATLHPLVKAIVNNGAWRHWPRLWLVTQGVHLNSAEASMEASMTQAPLWGYSRAVPHEHPNLRCSAVDISAQDLDALCNELLANGPETQITLRGNQRYVARLQRTSAPSTAVTIRSDGSYLITGGLGGLGLKVARWLAEHGAGELILVGRSQPSEEARAILNDLPATHGTHVTVLAADIANADDVSRIFEHCDGSTYQLRGVIHAAGVLDDGMLLQLDADRFRKVMRPKVDGALLLHRHTAERPLDFLVLFSGIASLLGSPGQANYAAANAALDALANHRKQQGLPAVSINWGPWSEIGRVVAQSRSLSQRGVEGISTALGLEAFARLAASDLSNVAVMAFNLRQWRETYPALSASPLVSELSMRQTPTESPAKTAPDADDIHQQLAEAGSGWRQQALIAEHLRYHIAQVLRMSLTAVEAQTALKDLGFDSLLALELRNRLERSLKLNLPVTMVWTYPTVADLGDYLLTQLGLTADESPDVPTSAAPVNAEADTLDLLAQIEGMSDEDVAQAFQGGLDS